MLSKNSSSSKGKRRTAMKPKKQDPSVRVQQRSKTKIELNIRELNWTEKQRAIIELANQRNTKVLLLKGPAGCSKTTLAVYLALDMLKNKKVQDIVMVRSAVESADSSLGFLPGDVLEKFGVYLTPFNDKLEMFLTPTEVKALNEDKRLVSLPVNFVRGNEWNVRAVLIDEAQNMTVKELTTLVTRLGEHSKLVICADPEQTDLPPSKGGGFLKLWDRLNDEESQAQGIYCIEFFEHEIMRSALVRFLVNKLKGMK